MIRIHPEPSAAELAAIVAAVTAACRSATHEAEHPEPPPSRWRRAARDEALRGPPRD
ncbi:MAG: hypothetical protein H0W23_04880 [Chloroflexia bacterium]|nr:hypothetical protein [Chloroflexia bacterium]